MRSVKALIIAFLLGLTIFSSYKYFSSLKEKYDLLAEMERTNEQLTSLQSERLTLLKDLENQRALQNALTEENSGLQSRLHSSEASLLKAQADFLAAQTSIEELRNQFAIAKAENEALSSQLGEMKLAREVIAEEREMLKARLSSLVELKKAIRDIRRKMGGASREIQGRLQQDQIIIGNGGYMLKDGKPTYPTRVKIEVVPLPQND